MAEASVTMARTDASEQVVKLSRFVQLEGIDDSIATVFLSNIGARIRIPKGLYQILLHFEIPQPISDVLAAQGRSEKLLSALQNMQVRGFLVDAQLVEDPAAGRLVTDPPQRMFDVPAFRQPSRSDVVVIGVPSDSADRACAGARSAPLALREMSLHLLYAMDRLSQRPMGWYDADGQARLLDGVSISDAGDVFVDPGEDQQAIFQRLDQVLSRIGSAMPVVVGGDSSVCWPAIERLQRDAPLSSVRIGGPAQRSSCRKGFVSSTTLARMLLTLGRVRKAIHIAARISDDSFEHSEFVNIGALALRSMDSGILLDLLQPGERIYLGIDVGVLGVPGVARGSSQLTYAEVTQLIRSIGARCRIVGIDICGAVPARAGWNVTSMSVLHLLLLAIDAARPNAVLEKDRDDG